MMFIHHGHQLQSLLEMFGEVGMAASSFRELKSLARSNESCHECWPCSQWSHQCHES